MKHVFGLLETAFLKENRKNKGEKGFLSFYSVYVLCVCVFVCMCMCQCITSQNKPVIKKLRVGKLKCQSADDGVRNILTGYVYIHTHRLTHTHAHTLNHTLHNNVALFASRILSYHMIYVYFRYR